jgi:hypothetical protein
MDYRLAISSLASSRSLDGTKPKLNYSTIPVITPITEVAMMESVYASYIYYVETY